MSESKCYTSEEEKAIDCDTIVYEDIFAHCLNHITSIWRAHTSAMLCISEIFPGFWNLKSHNDTTRLVAVSCSVILPLHQAFYSHYDH